MIGTLVGPWKLTFFNCLLALVISWPHHSINGCIIKNFRKFFGIATLFDTFLFQISLERKMLEKIGNFGGKNGKFGKFFFILCVEKYTSFVSSNRKKVLARRPLFKNPEACSLEMIVAQSVPKSTKIYFISSVSLSFTFLQNLKNLYVYMPYYIS